MLTSHPVRGVPCSHRLKPSFSSISSRIFAFSKLSSSVVGGRARQRQEGVRQRMHRAENLGSSRPPDRCLLFNNSRAVPPSSVCSTTPDALPPPLPPEVPLLPPLPPRFVFLLNPPRPRKWVAPCFPRYGPPTPPRPPIVQAARSGGEGTRSCSLALRDAVELLGLAEWDPVDMSSYATLVQRSCRWILLWEESEQRYNNQSRVGVPRSRTVFFSGAGRLHRREGRRDPRGGGDHKRFRALGYDSREVMV